MQSSQMITAMSTFTADFFDALDTTLSDGSRNNSKIDISHINSNKSHLMREIREESLMKLVMHLEKMIKMMVMDSIFNEGVKRQRRAYKTHQNTYKHLYKVQLLLSMKLRAKLQWTFYRINKFSQECSMKDFTSLNKQGQNGCQIISKALKVEEKGNLNKIEEIFEQINILKNANQKQVKSIQFLKKMSNLLDKRKQKLFFQYIVNYCYAIERREHLIEWIFLLVNMRVRSCFLELQNCYKNQSQKRSNIALSRVSNSSKIISQQDPHQKQSHSKEKVVKFSPKSPRGLKFNKGLKIKSQNSSTLNQQSQIRSPFKKQENISIAKICTISNIKATEVIIKLKEQSLQKQVNFQDFVTSQNIYHIAPQEYNKQPADLQVQFNLEIYFKKQDQNSTNRSSSTKGKLAFNRGSNSKKQSKKSFQVSNYSSKQKNKRSQSQRSKKSTTKTEEKDLENILNVQSIKSYYYPQNQKLGKGQEVKSTKFIGSTKWTGQKKRACTQTDNHIKTAKSHQKLNPYFQELQAKIQRKSPSRVINPHKVVEKKLASRSNSKTQKQKSEKSSQKPKEANKLNNKNVAPLNSRNKAQPSSENVANGQKQQNVYQFKSIRKVQTNILPKQIKAKQAPLQFNRLNTKSNKNLK